MLEERVGREVLADGEQEDGEMLQELLPSPGLGGVCVCGGGGDVCRRGGRKLGGGPRTGAGVPSCETCNPSCAAFNSERGPRLWTLELATVLCWRERRRETLAGGRASDH